MKKSVFVVIFLLIFGAREAFSAPTKVGDLGANPATPYSITVCWTAPTPTPGKVLTAYDLRYSTAPIGALNWTSRTQFVGEPTPAAPGSQECKIVPGLNVQTTYWFALKSQDSGSTWSVLSNLAVTITYAATKTVALSWNPPTTNADGTPPYYNDGTPLDDLAGYKLYYGTASGSYPNVIDVGNVTTYQVPNLIWGAYYFAVAAYDTAGNLGDYSVEKQK